MSATKAYLVPFSEAGLHNVFFNAFKDPEVNIPPFSFLREFLLRNGIEMNTIDLWREDRRSDQDVLVVFDHPPAGFYKLAYRLRGLLARKRYFPLKTNGLGKILGRFSKKILFLWESPVNMPWMYSGFERISALYSRTYSIPKVPGAAHFYYPQNFNSWNRTYFDRPRDKFMMMMNNPHRAKGYKGMELYTKRVDALTFFAKFHEVDLWGGGWDRVRDHALRGIWQGRAKNKAKTVSQYRFALCFENAIWPGYVTEKIFDCFYVGTVPIYWGATDVEEDIPRECFIDMRDFSAKGGSASGGRDYGELRAFLHSLSPERIGKYREAIREYFQSEQFRKFTKEHFAETVLRAVSE